VGKSPVFESPSTNLQQHTLFYIVTKNIQLKSLITISHYNMHLSTILGLGAVAVTNAAESRNILYYDQ
jgi:hypothetical protein